MTKKMKQVKTHMTMLMSDCEDAPGPNGSNNGEDIEAAANIHD